MVQDVSRTFAVSIEILDEPMSSYVCVGYLVCRIADTIEDAQTLSPAEKRSLLVQYERVFDPADEYDGDAFEPAVNPHLPAERTADWLVVANSNRVVRTFATFPEEIRSALRPPILELIAGMSRFVNRYADEDGIRIHSRAELEEYCYYVAGTIGQFMTNLLKRDITDQRVEARLEQTAEEFGLLLQLVNIAKDFHDDYTLENNVYLPASWLSEAAVPRDDLLSSGATDNLVSVIERTVDLARSYLDDAHRYLDTVGRIDRNAFVAYTIPFLLAVATLRELSKRPADALNPGGVKISREEVGAVVDVVKSTDDHRSLAELRAEINQRELR
jgi:farnesyl-diphosphate farnesyltransferase